MRLIVLLALLAAVGACRSGDLTFASVPWGSEAAEVQRMMVERGFSFVTTANEQGDHLYAGPYQGRRAVVVARMAEGRLAKFEVGIQPEDSQRLALFTRVSERLTAEYGSERGTGSVEPVPGEGTEALRTRVWSRRTRGGESFLILEDRPELAIVISFESPAWHEEFLRRQRR